MAEGLSQMPGGFAIEDGARVAIHPESDGIESFLRDAGEIGAFKEEAADERRSRRKKSHREAL